MRRDDLADIVLPLEVRGDERFELGDIVERVFRLVRARYRCFCGVLRLADDAPRQRQRMPVIGGIMIRDARAPRMHIRAAEIFGGDHLAGRGLHQRRAAEKDRALIAHDDRLIATSPAHKRRPPCRSPSPPRSAECPCRTASPDCRRCARNARDPGKPRSDAAGSRRRESTR